MLTLLFTKWQTKLEDFSFDRFCTIQAKGLAIILVILGHLNDQFENIKLLQSFGSMGVALFLFVSGYGLTKSYEKNRLDNFFKKRIKTVMLPYSLVTMSWILLDLVMGVKHSGVTVISGLIGFDFSRSIDPTMWYITFLLIWYAVFYLVFAKVKSNLLRLTLLIFVSMLCVVVWVFNLVGSGSYQWGLHSIIFPIGVWFALYGEKIVKKYKNRLLLMTMLITLVICAINIRISLSSGIYNAVNDLFFMSLIVCGLILIRQVNFKSLFLEHVGKYSYEIYLFEGYFLYRLNVFEVIDNKTVALFVYLALVLVLTFILNKITTRINKPNEYLNNKEIKEIA